MSAGSQWRIGADVRSRDLGAAGVFAAAVDWDDVPAFPVIGMVRVLGTWVWLEGRDIAWWLGAVVEARSAASAAERVASAIAEHTGVLHSRAMTLNVTGSTAQTIEEFVAEEELDLHRHAAECRAVRRPGSRPRLPAQREAPDDRLDLYRRPARPRVGQRDGVVTIALFEHRSPLTGPGASGDPMIARGRHVVLDVGEVPAGPPVLDRYAGEYLSESATADHSAMAPIKAFIYVGEEA